MNDQDYALLVGINYYPGLNNHLQGAETDATEFGAWLQREDGGDVPAANIKTLVSSQFQPPWPTSPGDARPTAEQFDCALVDLVIDPMTGQQYPNRRRLYLYLSGHGFLGQAQVDEAAVFAANMTRASYRHIAAARYAMWAQAAATYEEIVLVVDCCRDLSPSWMIQSPSLAQVQNPARAALVRKLVWYAAPPGAKSKERAIGNGPVRGLFTTVLLEALDKALPDEEGNVTGTAVANYAHTRWHDVAGGELPPVLPVDSAREIVLATRTPAMRRANRQRVVFVVPNAGQGAKLSVGDGNKELMTLPVDGAPPACDLPPGFYKVELVGSQRSTLFQVAGEDQDVII